jgi:hypothetical protein
MSDELTAEMIDELERLEREAHPGPWERAYHKVVFTHPENWKGLRTEVRGTSFVGIECHATTRQIDAEFIAALRNAAPALIASARLAAERGERIRELEEEIMRIKRTF